MASWVQFSNFQISTSAHLLHAEMAAHVWILLEVTAVTALLDGLGQGARVIYNKLFLI